jgi:hypothetical protein
MPPKETTLFRMLVEDLGSRFLKQFAERTSIIYKEAESRSFQDDAVHESFKAYHCGHTRFALHQSMFLRLAQECGMKTEIRKCPENGFPIAIVSAGRFFFTDHYATSPDELSLLDPSLMRQQNAGVNLELVQNSLFKPAFDEKKLRKAEQESVYANLIHGCRGVGSDFLLYGFLRIAFPCVKSSVTSDDAQLDLTFVENHNLNDVLAKVLEKESAGALSVASVSVAVPKIKKRSQNQD